MAIHPQNNPAIKGALGALGDFARTIGPYNGINIPPLAKPVESTAREANSPERLLFHYKNQALDMAKQMAAEREKAYETAKAAGLDVGKQPDPRPTMTDYFHSCEKLGEQRSDEMKANGVEWSPAVYANLSGHRIDGFQINRAHLEPAQEVLETATLRAMQSAKESGKPVKTSDILSQLGQLQRSGEKIDTSPAATQARKEGLAQLQNILDLDGDQIIAKLYETIDRHANFKGTIFSNVNFHPAGTLMRNDENGVAWTAGASFENVTFDGMGDRDHVVFAGKEFNNIIFSNIKGGSITIPDRTQVDGMDISGAYAELHIGGRASVSGLNASNARIIKLTAADGAEIHHATFNGATIDMGSELAGSKWSDVTFKDSNLAQVDANGMILAGVTMINCDLDGLSLKGAQIQSLTINGERITSAERLVTLGIEADETTQFIGSQAPRMAQAPSRPIHDPLSAAIAAAAAAAPYITGVDTTPGAAAVQTAAVDGMKRTVDPNQVARPGDRSMAPNRGEA